MRRKNAKPLLEKGVVVDSHRGLVYFDDVACRIKQFHDKGVRNLYSVVMTYALRGKEKVRAKTIRMDYGNFYQAQGRFRIETSSEVKPSKMVLKDIRMTVSTFDGRKLVNEEVLRKVEYKTRKFKIGDTPLTMDIGEETY